MKRYYCSKYIAEDPVNGKLQGAVILHPCTHDCAENHNFDYPDEKMPCEWQICLDDAMDFTIATLETIQALQKEDIDLEYARMLP